MAHLLCVLLLASALGTGVRDSPGVVSEEMRTNDDHPGLLPRGSSFVMYFAGDVNFAHRFEETIGDEVYRPFEKFRLFEGSDLTLVNLEKPITTRGEAREKDYVYRMKPRYIATLKDAGITVVNIANNHMLDYGPAGSFDTIDALDSARLPHCGAGRSLEEARTPVLRDTPRGRTATVSSHTHSGIFFSAGTRW